MSLRLLAGATCLCLQACAPAAGTAVGSYSSDADGFTSWRPFLQEGDTRRNIVLEAADGPRSVRLVSEQGRGVGINRMIEGRRGSVVFEYRIAGNQSPESNVFVVAIPVQRSVPTAQDPGAVLEVGAARPGDPANAHSLLRRRFAVPVDHHRSGAWHHGRLEFDFTTLKEASMVIVGLRLNEGARHPAPAAVTFRQVHVTWHERDAE